MQGTKRENKGDGGNKVLRVGWAEGRVVAINPSKEEFGKIGIDVDEEPKYSKDKDGEEIVWIDFWMEELKTGHKYKHTFFLQDETAKSKPKDGEEDGFVAKTQYVNQVGDSVWVEKKADLNERFTKFRRPVKGSKTEFETYGDKVVRVAKKGEGDLMAFVRQWMSGMDYRNVNTNILLDLKKIFNGNFKELKEQIGGQFTTTEYHGKEVDTTIASVLEVKVVDGEDGQKEYQSVWRRTVAGWHMKAIRNTKFTRENIAKWIEEGKSKANPSGTRYLKDYEKVAIEISTGQYKSKNFYSLDLAHDYNTEENFVASKENVVREAVSSDDDDY